MSELAERAPDYLERCWEVESELGVRVLQGPKRDQILYVVFER